MVHGQQDSSIAILFLCLKWGSEAFYISLIHGGQQLAWILSTTADITTVSEQGPSQHPKRLVNQHNPLPSSSSCAYQCKVTIHLAVGTEDGFGHML